MWIVGVKQIVVVDCPPLVTDKGRLYFCSVTFTLCNAPFVLNECVLCHSAAWGEGGNAMTPAPPLRQFAAGSALHSLHVTEDTPPDLLEGAMDLVVILPSRRRVNMQVHRRSV